MPSFSYEETNSTAIERKVMAVEERQKGTESDRPKIHSWFPVSISSDGGKEGQYNPETRAAAFAALPLYMAY